MYLRGVFTLVALALITCQAQADIGITPKRTSDTPNQTSSLQIPLNKGLQEASSLLDLNRLSFNHTLGVTYSTGQSGGLSQYYLNEITYQISKPLVIKAQVGVANNLSATTRYGSNSGVQVVVPNISVLYQPKPNLRIEFGFSNMPNYYGQPSYGFYAPH